MCTVSYQPGSHTVRNTKLRQHLDTKRLNTVKSQLIRTSSKMTFNSIFTAEIFTTWTTTKRFVAQVYQLMSFQFTCCIETFGHSRQTYGFTPSCRRKWSLRLPLWLTFFWQMWHVNQVPSLCDFNRCLLSWTKYVKRSEQCLHEYGFAPVWIRTWRCSSVFILNSFPQ